MYKVTCFIQEEKHQLFPLLTPLGFSVVQDHLIWQNEKSRCIIKPFSIRGRNTQGYRIYFYGSPEFGEYFFQRAMGCFEPTISGVEYLLQTQESQRSLINTAEKIGLTRGCLYGIYKFEQVGIVILPNGEINFQIRGRKFSYMKLACELKEIEQAVYVFKPQTFNLFSISEGDEEEEAIVS